MQSELLHFRARGGAGIGAVLAVAAAAWVMPARAELPAETSHGLITMAPADRWAARLEMRANGYGTWFDNDGHARALGAPFDKVNLDSAIFPPLAGYGAGASLGTTSFNSRVSVAAVTVTAGCGLSEDLTAGFILPYARVHNHVNFSVDGGNVGGGTATVQQFLTDPAYGYAYKPIGDAVTSGIGDPTIGALWRFHKGAHDSAVLALGVHVGLAAPVDPDNATALAVSDGASGPELRLEYFRALGRDSDLRLLARYYGKLSDYAVMRVPAPGALLATAASKERLARHLGDFVEFDVEVGRSWGDWRGSLTWHLYDKAADRYVSALGTDTAALNANTRVRADQWRAGLSWSGLRDWRAGRQPVPLIVKLEMQDTYGGRNFPKVRDLYLQLTSFF